MRCCCSVAEVLLWCCCACHRHRRMYVHVHDDTFPHFSTRFVISQWFARYVDGQFYCQRTQWDSSIESYEPYQAPFDTEFELLLNLAVGGDFPGRTVDDSIFPVSMMVDYVRYCRCTLLPIGYWSSHLRQPLP